MNFNKLIMKVYKNAIRDIFHAYVLTTTLVKLKKDINLYRFLIIFSIFDGIYIIISIVNIILLNIGLYIYLF